MDCEELEALAAQPESDRVERKESLGDGENIRQAVCAFANDLPNHRLPGVVVLGLKNSGGCAGLAITDDLLNRLSDIGRDGSIIPLPHIQVSKLNLRGCDVAVVAVWPSDAPPVRWRQQVWVRVGPSTQAGNQQQVRMLGEKRRSGDLPFDVRPLPSASLAELDTELFRSRYLPAYQAPGEPNHRRPADQMVAVRFAGPATGSVCPTALGVLCLTPDPARFIPGAYVQFLRFDGADLSSPIVNEVKIASPLLELLVSLDDLLKSQIRTSVDLAGSNQEIQRPDYPLVALQQLVRNAVMHRDYENSHAPIRINWFSDRIEIHNPGGPYGQVTTANFGQGLTDYRNPSLAGVMRDLGYVQRFGVGIATARKVLRENGNPELRLEPQPGHVLATVEGRS